MVFRRSRLCCGLLTAKSRDKCGEGSRIRGLTRSATQPPGAISACGHPRLASVPISPPLTLTILGFASCVATSGLLCYTYENRTRVIYTIRKINGHCSRSGRGSVREVCSRLGCSIPGYVPGYEGMHPPPRGMLSVPWAQGMVKCTLIKHQNKTINSLIWRVCFTPYPGRYPFAYPIPCPGGYEGMGYMIYRYLFDYHGRSPFLTSCALI